MKPIKTLLAALVLQGVAAAQTAPDLTSFDPDVLTPSGRQAYAALLSMRVATGTSVGIAGISAPDAPLYYLWDDPGGEQALRALLVEASPAGRFLALCGLHALDPELYEAGRELLADDEEPVMLFPGGCVGYELPLAEAVQTQAPDMASKLRRHWEVTKPARSLEPGLGYELGLSPTGRQAMEILRAAAYVDGAFWLPLEDAIGPTRALHDLLSEDVAADGLLDLLHSTNPAARFYGVGGLMLVCPAAVPKAAESLKLDTEEVRLEVEGRCHTLSVADATKLLLERRGNWFTVLRGVRQDHERKLERERKQGQAVEAEPFERYRLPSEHLEAYDALAGAELVQLGRWSEPTPSTLAVLSLWDADEAAGAFEHLAATASPAGRLLALCGLWALDRDRARRVELALRKSGLTVRTLAEEGPRDVGMEVVVAALVHDGTLPSRLRSEWSFAHGGAQDDPRRELSPLGFRLPPTLTPSGFVTHPYRKEEGGFGSGLAQVGEQLLVGSNEFIDPLQRGSVFVLRPGGRDSWTPAQTLLPSSRTLGFGEQIAASHSMLLVLRGGGTYGNNVQVDGAVEVYERGDGGWVRSAAFEIEQLWITGFVVDREKAVVAGGQSAFVVERAPGGWERRDLPLPEGAFFQSKGCADLDGDRIALGHRGGVSVLERTGAGWTISARLTDAEDGPLGFVTSVALEGDRLLVGHYPGSYQSAEGSVVAFRHRDGRWLPEQTLLASDSLPGDNFGDRLALDGDRLVALGRGGPARLFTLDQGLWRERAKLVAGLGSVSEPVPYHALGAAVCDLDGNRLLISIPGDREEAGRVAVFDVAAALRRSR